MADYRQIHTLIWKDDWFVELTPNEKLLFIYLFSNSNSNLGGLYKISLKVMEFETGLSKEVIELTLQKFELSQRIVYRDGIIWVVHMSRYHSHDSPKVQIKIRNDLDLIPECPVKMAYLYYQNTGKYSMDTVSIQYQYCIVNKEEERKEEDNKEKGGDDSFSSVCKKYQGEIGLLTPIIADKIKLALEEYPAEWIEEAIDIAVTNNARNWGYTDGILKRWKVDGFKNKKPSEDTRLKQLQELEDKKQREAAERNKYIG